MGVVEGDCFHNHRTRQLVVVCLDSRTRPPVTREEACLEIKVRSISYRARAEEMFALVCLHEEYSNFVGLGLGTGLGTGLGSGLGGGLATGVVKFEPVTGTDTVNKNGITQTVNTKLHCISAMKQYEQSSLEVQL